MLEKVEKAWQLPYPQEEAKAGEGSKVTVSQLAGVLCPHTQASGDQCRALSSLGLRVQGPSSPVVNGGSAMCGIPLSYSIHMGEEMEGSHQPHWMNLSGTGHKPPIHSAKLDSPRVALRISWDGQRVINMLVRW